MPFIGFSSVPIQIALGDFFCPACRDNRRFELKEISNLFEVFLIPVHKKSDRHLVCLTCDRVFPPSLESLQGTEAIAVFLERFDIVALR